MYGHFRYKVEMLMWVEAETPVYGFRLFRPRKPEVTGMNFTTIICKHLTVVFSLMHILLKDFTEMSLRGEIQKASL